MIVSKHSMRVVPPLLLLALVLTGCSRTASDASQPTKPETITSSKPPFQTKEPERYRAVRVITTTEGPNGTSGTSRTIRIARNGSNRREEYQTTAGETVIYLENAAGTFVLLPSAKLVANLNTLQPGDEQLETVETETAHATEAMLNQVSTEATYRKLGLEQVGDRTATKYRVSHVASPSSSAPTQESFVWIDEALGMPIRSETIYVSGDSSSKVVIELRDIILEVEDRLFELPTHYKTVTYQALLEQFRR